MLHKKTYRIFEEDEPALVYEEILDEQSNIISYKDYQLEGVTEVFKEYDANGSLICEEEFTDGEEGSRTVFVYNAEGSILNVKQFVAGELFEEQVYEYLERGFIMKTIQHGEEIKRLIESKNGNKFVLEFFEGTHLVEHHAGEYDPETRTEKVKLTDGEGNLLEIRIELFDEFKNLLKYEVQNENGNVIVLTEYKYENNRIVFERHNDYIQNQHHETFYEYDSFGNMISREVKSPSGKLNEYQKQIFNEQNRLISESGFTLGSYDAIYGTNVVGEKYTFKHEYNEL